MPYSKDEQRREMQKEWNSWAWLLREDIRRGDEKSLEYRIQTMRRNMGSVGISKSVSGPFIESAIRRLRGGDAG